MGAFWIEPDHKKTRNERIRYFLIVVVVVVVLLLCFNVFFLLLKSNGKKRELKVEFLKRRLFVQ